jgi:hypothetical protein
LLEQARTPTYFNETGKKFLMRGNFSYFKRFLLQPNDFYHPRFSISSAWALTIFFVQAKHA